MSDLVERKAAYRAVGLREPQRSAVGIRPYDSFDQRALIVDGEDQTLTRLTGFFGDERVPGSGSVIRERRDGAPASSCLRMTASM